MLSSNFFNKSSKNHLVNNSAGVLSVLSQTPEFTESKAISSLYSGFLLGALSDLYERLTAFTLLTVVPNTRT